MKRVLLIGLALVAFGCGDDDDPESEPEPVRTEAVESTEPPGEDVTAQATDDASGGQPPPIQLTPIFAVRDFDGRIVDLDPIPGEEGRYLGLYQAGVVILLDESAPEDAATVVDLQDRVNDERNEEGLLGLAFAPDWEDSRNLYMYYTAADPRRGVLSRFTFDGTTIDPASEQVLLEVDQPFANHNGGSLAFGPDGYLYLGLGDGGSRGDPMGNGQNGNLLGSILRLDVSGSGIAIPPDNPFVGGARGFEEEIYAYGLRNPWRFSFDRDTGQFWVGDVGQNAFEEVDLVVAGGNYGWNIMEGPECFQPDEGCDQSGLELPVAYYSHEEGCSITGGYVYRGEQIDRLNGWYLYSDFCSGRIWALNSEDPSQVVVLLDSSLPVSSFAEDVDGELFVLAFDGRIYRIEAA